MMDSTSQIKIGAMMSYLSIGINIISGLIYTPWMIHSIGRENYGLYALAMSVISIFVFDFGLSFAVTRFVAKYLAEGRQDKANNCIGLVYRLYFIIDILLFIILGALYFFISDIYKELTTDELDKFKVIYVMASVYSVISFPFIPVNGILTAHEKFVQLKFCEVAHKLLVVGLMTVCLLLGYGLYALVFVNTVAGTAIILAKLWVIRYHTPQRVTLRYRNRFEFQEILGFSGWITLVALSQRFIFSFAPSILGIFSGSTSIAILGIAVTIEGYIYTFSTALSGMFLPKVSRVVTNNSDELLPLMIKVGRIQILIISSIVIGFICLGHDFILLWVGEKFDESYLCAVLIVLPSLLYSPQEIANSAVMVMNQVRKQAIVYLITSAFNIICILVLVKMYDALAVCISVCMTYTIRTIWMDVIYYKDMKINVIQFFKDSYGCQLLPLLLLSGAILLLRQINPLELTWISFIVEGLIFMFLYIAVMWAIGMNRDEKDLLLVPIRKIISFIDNK